MRVRGVLPTLLERLEAIEAVRPGADTVAVRLTTP